MANLIITIISIALVAVAALMAAWYGGQSFMSAGDKANATTLVKQAEQINSALVLYRSTVGTNPTNGLYEYVVDSQFSTYLVPNFLSSIPVPISEFGGSWKVASQCNTTIGHVCTGTWQTFTGKWVITLTGTGDRAANICLKVQEMIGKTALFQFSPSDLPTHGAWFNQARPFKYSCAYIDANLNATFDPGESVQFFYWVN